MQRDVYLGVARECIKGVGMLVEAVYVGRGEVVGCRMKSLWQIRKMQLAEREVDGGSSRGVCCRT